MVLGWLMYYKDDRDQLGIDEFFLPFGGKLNKDNRWVRTAEIMPWDDMEEVYLKSMSQETDRAAFPARIAYGAIYVKEQEGLTDEETVEAIAENPYIQYFLGLKEFRDKPLFNASMMVHFRKRFPVETLAKINEYICTGKRPEDEERNDGNEPPTSGGAAGKPNKIWKQRSIFSKTKFPTKAISFRIRQRKTASPIWRWPRVRNSLPPTRSGGGLSFCTK